MKSEGIVIHALCFLALSVSGATDGGLKEADLTFKPHTDWNNVGNQKNEDQHLLGLQDVAFFIRTQRNKYHIKRAEILRDNLTSQSSWISSEERIQIALSSDEVFPLEAWIITPVLKTLKSMFSKSKWIFFCEESTKIKLDKLLQFLGKNNFTEPMFLGHALKDEKITLLHHELDPAIGMTYPDFDAGWALSMPAIDIMLKMLDADERVQDYFSLDVQHEIAVLLFQDGKGHNLTHVPQFCINEDFQNTDCVSTCLREEPKCGETPTDDILVSVKTCEKFHKTRLPVVLQTVANQTRHIVYYSDVEDPTIPTTVTGVPNQRVGHCMKLQEIIRLFHVSEAFKDKRWLVVIDDDTVMNFNRLRKVIACYDDNEIILLGQRFGVYLTSKRAQSVEYATGGSGMIMSRAAVTALIESGCSCRVPDQPDDVWLGRCFGTMGKGVLHTPSLHQIPPAWYDPAMLSHQYLVSFHKHYGAKPMIVYEQYLADVL